MIEEAGKGKIVVSIQWQKGYQAFMMGFDDIGPYDANTRNGAKKQKMFAHGWKKALEDSMYEVDDWNN